MADPNQPAESRRPDLEDPTNGADPHGAILNDLSAAKREKHLHEAGPEPVPLWIILGSTLVLLVAGGVLGAGGGLFRYHTLRIDGYVREAAPGGGDSVPLTAPVMTALTKNGAKIYSKCIACHQSSGLGDGANYPPLGGSEWVQGDTEAIAMIILNGLQGEITVKGKTWNSTMAPLGLGMSAADLASVMTYVRNSFGNTTGDVVTLEMAANAIKISRERAGGAPMGPPMTAAELKEKHARMLPGDAMDPNTLVDLQSFAPVERADSGE